MDTASYLIHHADSFSTPWSEVRKQHNNIATFFKKKNIYLFFLCFIFVLLVWKISTLQFLFSLFYELNGA